MHAKKNHKMRKQNDHLNARKKDKEVEECRMVVRASSSFYIKSTVNFKVNYIGGKREVIC